MKSINITFLIFMIATLSAKSQNEQDTTIYQFKVESLEGEEFDFNNLKGKKIP